MDPRLKKLAPAVLAGSFVLVGYALWSRSSGGGPVGLTSGNGRIEATEVDVATRLGGRLEEVLVEEGQLVKAGQPLARMQADVLLAQRAEALARREQALEAVPGALAQVALRESDRAAAQAALVQRETELALARRRLGRTEQTAHGGGISEQQLDEERARARTAEAAVDAVRAQLQATRAAIVAARTQVTGARAAVVAAEASVARVEVDLADTVLKAPRDGRVQYRLAEPGEVLAAGGKVLNLVDLGDVYMTFFLPETIAGRVALGSEVRIRLDVAPDLVIPAKVSFVASTAQFTPKTVETASERQKLMFRVKAHIDRELLRSHVDQVKTGLPGVAWVRTDPRADWPAELAANVRR